MEIDTNAFYRLSTAAATKLHLSLAGSYAYLQNAKGLVSGGYSDNDSPSQQWQLFPVGPSTVMLRTRASGSNGYLATAKNKSMTPQIFDYAKTDNSMLWTIDSWGDGTFLLGQKASGKQCYLDFEGTDRIRMRSNTTIIQSAQAFSLVKLGQINDPAFSTVRRPPASASTQASTSTQALPSILVQATTASFDTSVFAMTDLARSTETTLHGITTASLAPIAATTTATATATARTQHVPQALSLPAAMGIGVTIGVLSIIFLISITLYLYQRWGPGRPQSVHHQREKMWDGFTPAASDSTRYLIRTKSPPPRIVLAELPDSPPAVFSPEVSGGHMSWNSRVSWLESPYSPYFDLTPTTPARPPSELPV